jgi:hypothetical protein
MLYLMSIQINLLECKILPLPYPGGAHVFLRYEFDHQFDKRNMNYILQMLYKNYLINRILN